MEEFKILVIDSDDECGRGKDEDEDEDGDGGAAGNVDLKPANWVGLVEEGKGGQGVTLLRGLVGSNWASGESRFVQGRWDNKSRDIILLQQQKWFEVGRRFRVEICGSLGLRAFENTFYLFDLFYSFVCDFPYFIHV